MRLTNTIRSSFVRAAMADVPAINYEEQAQKVAKAQLLAMLPASIVKLTRDAIAEPFISREYITMPSRFSNFPYYCERNQSSGLRDKHPEVWAKIMELHAQHEAQTKAHRDLQSKLQACADSATTRKALVTMLPEFEKYLPEDEQAACKTLPAIANVLSDFVKAGWPKSQPKIIRTAP